MRSVLVAVAVMVALGCGSTVEPQGGSGGGGGVQGGAEEGGAGGLQGPGGAPEGGAADGGASMGGMGEGGADPLFPELDDGPWLIGWSGGLDHYSWVIFTYTAADEGTALVVDSECASCAPYFDCSGPTTFSISAANTIALPMPAPCAAIVSLGFGPLEPTQGYPPSALQHATISGKELALDAFLFPPEHCTPSPPACGDPFQ